MPSTMTKPFDYAVDLLVKAHPTLREYCTLKMQSEVDPDYHLYTYPRNRIEQKDEIMLRNNVGGSVSSYTMNITKTVAGSFINTLDVPTQNLPGNFGVRVIETMPTNLSDVWRERKTT